MYGWLLADRYEINDMFCVFMACMQLIDWLQNFTMCKTHDYKSCQYSNLQFLDKTVTKLTYLNNGMSHHKYHMYIKRVIFRCEYKVCLYFNSHELVVRIQESFNRTLQTNSMWHTEYQNKDHGSFSIEKLF